MRRLCSVLLCMGLILLLLPTAPAHAAGSLEQEIGLFIEKNGLSKENFSLAFYHTATGENCSYNGEAMLPAGDLWMLPLHMYFCEQESMGAFDPSFERPMEDFTIGGLTLKECRYQSLLLGKAEVAVAMRDYLGGHVSFKTLVNEAFGHLSQEAMTQDYLNRNYFSADFWISCLRELTDHPEIYDELSRYYTILQTADGLAGFSQSYSIFQLRGQEDGWLTAMAKVWTPEPYLLVCSIQAGENGDVLLAALNELICSYITQQADAPKLTLTPTTEPRDLSVATEKQNRTGEMLRWIAICLGGVLGVAAIIGLPIWIIRRRKEDVYYD